MMRLIMFIVVFTTITGCTELQLGNSFYASSLALESVDWGQTRSIAKNPNRWTEMNPVLSAHPTVNQIDAYFPILITTTAISYPFLKPAARPWVYGWLTAIEAICVVNNARHGIHMDFVALKF